MFMVNVTSFTSWITLFSNVPTIVKGWTGREGNTVRTWHHSDARWSLTEYEASNDIMASLHVQNILTATRVTWIVRRVERDEKRTNNDSTMRVSSSYDNRTSFTSCEHHLSKPRSPGLLRGIGAWEWNEDEWKSHNEEPPFSTMISVPGTALLTASHKSEDVETEVCALTRATKAKIKTNVAKTERCIFRLDLRSRERMDPSKPDTGHHRGNRLRSKSQFRIKTKGVALDQIQ